MPPPLHNVCAVFEPDPRLRPALRQSLLDSGFFSHVTDAPHGWLFAISPVGQVASDRTSTPVLESAQRGWVFCEHSQLDATETELLQTSEHAPETLARYPGDFTFLRVREDGSLILVRSCAGKVPLYYAKQHERILVASRLDYMVAFAAAPVRLDGLGTALALTSYGSFPNGRSPIAGVHCLASAHYLTIVRGHEAGHAKPTPVRYWTPRRTLQWPTAARKAEHAAQLHASLSEHLQRELAPSGGNLLWLSGGVDSSALAALIAGELAFPLWTQSFTASDPATAHYDDSYLLSLSERYRFQRSWRETHTAERCLELAQKGPRVSYPVCYFPLSALSATQRAAAVSVVIGGELADEGTGSHRLIGDWLDHAGPLAGLNPLRAPNGLRTPQQWLAWQLKRPVHKQWLRLPEGLGLPWHSSILQEFQDWASKERAQFAADEGPLRSLWFKQRQDAWRAEWWEACTSQGVRPLAAFCNRELLELYFDCHPLEWFDRQRPKALLRRAMLGRMPEWHRQRPDKGIWPEFLQNAQLPVVAPPRAAREQLSDGLLNDAWLNAKFPQGQGQSQLPALDALQLTWLTNMLGAVERLTVAQRNRSDVHPQIDNAGQPRISRAASFTR